jgi:hypothetical protein
MNNDEDIYALEDNGDDRTPYRSDAVPTQPRTQFVVRCNKCGYDLKGLTIGEFCPECGHQIGLPGSQDAPTSGSAVTALVMGILAIISCTFYGVPGVIFGPLAMYFAARAKKQVLAGQASTSSLGLANAGRVLGIIGLIIGALSVLAIVAFIIFFGVSISQFP